MKVHRIFIMADVLILGIGDIALAQSHDQHSVSPGDNGSGRN
jgi:hypothetical protein